MFSSYPSEHAPDFAEQIRSLEASGQLTQRVAEDTLRSALRTRRDRFAALYYLLYRANRELRYREYQELCQEYEAAFGKSPYYDTFRAIATAEDRSNTNALARAIVLADRACRQLADRPGVLHLYASLVADLAELNKDHEDKTLELALTRVRRAIGLLSKPNPHFFATEARLCYISGDPLSALNAIDDAIRLQDAAGTDAVRRLTKYESIRTRITMGIDRKELENLVQQVRSELVEERGKSLQVLAVLAAVIALLSLGATRTPVGSSELLSFVAIFSSMIVLVFATLLLLLQLTRPGLFAVGLLLSGVLAALAWVLS